MTNNGDTNDQPDRHESEPAPDESQFSDDSTGEESSQNENAPSARIRTRTRTRTRTRRTEDEGGDSRNNTRRPARAPTTAGEAPTDPGGETSTEEPPTEGAEESAQGSGSGAETDGDSGQGTRRRPGRRRGSRGGRSRRGRARGDQEDAAGGEGSTPQEPASGEGGYATSDRTAVTSTEVTPDPETRSVAEPEEARSGTGETSTLQEAEPRGRKKPSARTGQRPFGGISEETRRAITEGPPRRMLVTTGEQRSQVAVLENRDLVEHYVTDRHDTSYVGNIYMGRVQNVLPGMEAAFVDIGKGRNGVLYAGEVNYDEGDLDGQVPRIEQSLEPGQSVLVQVTKDPMGTKGARLTQNLSIAGRYCVLTQGDGTLGISRKLPDEERERLREILGDIRPTGHGLIVRTAAEGATSEQLENDISRLARIWGRVEERRRDASPLEPVYEEPDLVIRVIRDAFGPEYTDLVVDSEELGKQVRDYLSDVSPELVDRVSVHTGEVNLFDDYEVTNQIRRGLEKKVWLGSGGYLIIEKTEAMWVIDVNTGKFVGESNLEETVLRNNLEAAEEIARQLRLRDMGGIIVIDFVDMLVPANRDEVLKRFKRELARDKTKSRVMQISKLGLVEMTRKNVSQGLQESFTETCETCEGRGAVMVHDILN